METILQRSGITTLNIIGLKIGELLLWHQVQLHVLWQRVHEIAAHSTGEPKTKPYNLLGNELPVNQASRQLDTPQHNMGAVNCAPENQCSSM